MSNEIPFIWFLAVVNQQMNILIQNYYWAFSLHSFHTVVVHSRITHDWSRLTFRNILDISPGDPWGVGSCRIQIMAVGSDGVVVGFYSVGIRHGFCRNSSESDEIHVGSGQIFMGFRRIPTKSVSDSDWKESDNNPIGSDRFLREDVGSGWNPIGNDRIYRSDRVF